MALIVAPEPPLGDWLAALDQQMSRSAGFFAERPIIADFTAAMTAREELDSVLATLDALDARDLRLVGVDGVDPALLAGTRWARLPSVTQGRDLKGSSRVDRPVTAPGADPPPAAPKPSLLIDRPVRSGQSVVFEDGDVTIVGPVASGAEVVAGGSVHVYGALRGRVIAGLRIGSGARIFCRKLEAELIAVEGLYRTADHWGQGLHGCGVQIWCDRGTLRISALD